MSSLFDEHSCLSSAALSVPATFVETAWIGHAPFAFHLIATLKPKLFVELGTHAGYSYFAFCQAVKEYRTGTVAFAVDTWEGDEHAGFYTDNIFQSVRQKNDDYSSFSSLMRMRFDEAANYFEDGSIDLIHIDGRHLYEDVKQDFEVFFSKLSSDAIVLFHDTNVRERNFGVSRFFNELKGRFPSFEFVHSHGLGLLAVGNIPKEIKCFFEADEQQTLHIREIYSKLGEHCARFANAQVISEYAAKIEIELSDLKKEREFLLNQHEKQAVEIEKERELFVQQHEKQTAEIEKEREFFVQQHEKQTAEIDRLCSEVSEVRQRATVIENDNVVLRQQSHRQQKKNKYMMVRIKSAWRHPTNRAKRKKYREDKFNALDMAPDSIAPKPEASFSLKIRAFWRHPFNGNKRRVFLASRALALLSNGLERYSESHLPANDVRVSTVKMDRFAAWIAVNKLNTASIVNLKERLSIQSDSLPKISIVTPIYNTPEHLLRETVDSVLRQIYHNWELCLVNDASPDPSIAKLIEEIAASDSRIKIQNLNKNGGISRATNAGVEAATGDVLVFLDHDDLLTDDCLAELAIYYAEHPDADIVYSDDDKISENGDRYAPQFKPDWSPTLLLSFMYIGHVFSVKRELYVSCGGFKSEFDGSQDFEFALRATERARHIGHIPRILYHWRAVEGSTAKSGNEKPESFEAGRKAVEIALERRGITDTKVIHPKWAKKANCGMFSLIFPNKGPSVTIIIPSFNNFKLLRTCVESLLKTQYENFDILIVNNDSTDEFTCRYMEEINDRDNIRVVKISNNGKPFSYARVMNLAVEQCSSELVLFLNDDTKVINPAWLSQMVGYSKLARVGSVGARLYFEDGTIQHAGILHGVHDGLPGHAFRNLPPHDWGTLGLVRAARECSAVTAACMLTPRALFQKIGGFDEVNFNVAYNDVDYGYRLIKLGYLNIYCPDAELFHYEGKTRGFSDSPDEVRSYRKIYGEWKDPWFNPNLEVGKEDFVPANIRLTSGFSRKLNVAVVTHNLNHEGAPHVLRDLVIGLVRLGVINAVVYSPVDGPLRAQYEAEGIEIRGLPTPEHGQIGDAFDVRLNETADVLRSSGADVVLANTLTTWWAIAAAFNAGIPSIWCQHESEPWASYFDYLPEELSQCAYDCFAKAYRVVYVAKATMESWRALETRHNFKVIRHGVPESEIKEKVSSWPRTLARQKLNLGEGDIAVTLVGTVCQRKNQLDLVEAISFLSREIRGRLKVFIVGAIGESSYLKEINAKVNNDGLAHIVNVTGPMDDPSLYFASADIAVCTSRVESAPRVLLEAMAFGLPIITTPVFGIPEMVRENINAMFYPVGSPIELSKKLERLIMDDGLRGSFADNSRIVLDSLPGYEEMLRDYSDVLRQAAIT